MKYTKLGKIASLKFINILLIHKLNTIANLVNWATFHCAFLAEPEKEHRYISKTLPSPSFDDLLRAKIYFFRNLLFHTYYKLIRQGVQVHIEFLVRSTPIAFYDRICICSLILYEPKVSM